MNPSSQLVLLNHLRFHFLEWGNESAQPLLLLHGYTSHAHSWDTFAAAMADHFHVIALDQRGHGESAWTDDYAPERMVEDIAGFVRALDLQRIALLGLSMGGRNAYAYAAQHANTVERLVIVDIGPEIVASGSARIRSSAAANDVFASAEEAFQSQRSANQRPPEAEHRHRVMYNLMRMQDGQWTWRYDRALRAPDRPLPRPNPDAAWGWLAAIRCPTLLVRGAESDVLAVETANKMIETIPHCQLVTVPEAGHSVPLDNPSGFIEAVRPFLLGSR